MKLLSEPVLSIVVPVYFNQGTLMQLHERLGRVVDHLSVASEFIFVDDGSRDKSFEVLKALALIDVRVRVVKLARNFGSNAAILAGLSHARGKALAFVAADLQDPPEILAEMFQGWSSGHKVVFAVRNSRDDPPVDRLLANTFNFFFHKLVLQESPPTGIGFFLIDQQVSRLLIQCEERNANLMNLIIWLGFQPFLIRYDRPAREVGKSRWTITRKIKYAIDTLVAFSYLPIRMASLAGIGLSLLGALAIVYVLIARIFLNVPVEGWASLMIILLLVSGVQMVMLGILGEYLWRALDQTRRRPIFVVDSIVEDPFPNE